MRTVPARVAPSAQSTVGRPSSVEGRGRCLWSPPPGPPHPGRRTHRSAIVPSRRSGGPPYSAGPHGWPLAIQVGPLAHRQAPGRAEGRTRPTDGHHGHGSDRTGEARGDGLQLIGEEGGEVVMAEPRPSAAAAKSRFWVAGVHRRREEIRLEADGAASPHTTTMTGACPSPVFGPVVDLHGGESRATGPPSGRDRSLAPGPSSQVPDAGPEGVVPDHHEHPRLAVLGARRVGGGPQAHRPTRSSLTGWSEKCREARCPSTTSKKGLDPVCRPHVSTIVCRDHLRSSVPQAARQSMLRQREPNRCSPRAGGHQRGHRAFTRVPDRWSGPAGPVDPSHPDRIVEVAAAGVGEARQDRLRQPPTRRRTAWSSISG